MRLHREAFIKNFREAYNFIYQTYSKSSREKLLEFIGSGLSDEELKTYCNTLQIELVEIYSFGIAQRMAGIDKKGKQEVYGELRLPVLQICPSIPW